MKLQKNYYFKINMESYYKILILSKHNYNGANFIELIRDRMAGIFHARHV